MAHPADGLALYECPAAAVGPQQRDLLFEYVGEVTETDMRAFYGSVLISLKDH
jgi:hypothetical protein